MTSVIKLPNSFPFLSSPPSLFNYCKVSGKFSLVPSISYLIQANRARVSRWCCRCTPAGQPPQMLLDLNRFLALWGLHRKYPPFHYSESQLFWSELWDPWSPMRPSPRDNIQGVSAMGFKFLVNNYTFIKVKIS